MNKDPEVKLTPEQAALVPDTSHWCTRYQAADHLRMSVTTIANYERRGKLHPQYAMRPDGRDIERRVAVYDPEELSKLPGAQARHRAAAREPGEVAALCFELFEQNKSVREVVIELRETPDRVRELHNVWQNCGDRDVLITSNEIAVIEKILGASFTSVSELIKLIGKLAKASSSPA